MRKPFHPSVPFREIVSEKYLEPISYKHGRVGRVSIAMYARAIARDSSRDFRSYPSTMRKEIGIEDLLVWAYRDQMVHAARPEDEPVELGKAGPPRCAAMNFAIGGEARSNYGFEADPDAWIVHRAVGRLGEAMVTVEPPPRFGAVDVSRDDSLMWPQRFRVDVAKVTMAAAIDGGRPDWMPDGPGRLRDAKVTIWARGAGGAIKRHRVTGEQIGLLCVVKPEGPMPWEVERARAVYGVWWEGLASLRESLRGNVRRFEVTAKMPPRCPWDCS